MSHESWLTILGAVAMGVIFAATFYVIDWHIRGRRRNLAREVRNMINGNPMGFEGVSVWGNVRVPTGHIGRENRLSWFEKHNLKPQNDGSMYWVNWTRARNLLRTRWVSATRTACPWILAREEDIIPASTNTGRGAGTSMVVHDEEIWDTRVQELWDRVVVPMYDNYPQLFTRGDYALVTAENIANHAITTTRLVNTNATTRMPNPYDPPRPAQPQRDVEQEAAQPAAVPNEPAEGAGDPLDLQARPARDVSPLRDAVSEHVLYLADMYPRPCGPRYYRRMGERENAGGLGQLHRDDEGGH